MRWVLALLPLLALGTVVAAEPLAVQTATHGTTARPTVPDRIRVSNAGAEALAQRAGTVGSMDF